MKENLIQKAANITTLLNAIYNMQNRADIPRTKLRELEPTKKALETELWDVLVTQLMVKKKVFDVETAETISNRVAEEKAKLTDDKKVRKVKKSSEVK